MPNLIKNIYRSLFKSKKSAKTVIRSLDRKKIKTVRDFANESAKKYKNQPYINYEVNNELRSYTFLDTLHACEAYGAWMFKEVENEESGRGVHVGLLGIGSFNYFVAYLGSMYSKNVTVPMDPNLDVDTLVYCINHGDIDLIFYEPKFQAKIDTLKEKCPNVKRWMLFEKNSEQPETPNLDDVLEKYKGQRVYKRITPGDNAMMMYTSGTTGRKKGVVLTHDNIIDKYFSTFPSLGIPGEVYLCVLPLYHIFSSNDLFFPLRFGYKVYFSFDLSKLFYSLQKFEPTKASLVPLLSKNILNKINMNIKEHPELSVEEAKKQIIGKNFYKIQSGGGYLSPELIAEFNKLGISIGQGYGLTETTSKASISDFNPKKVASVGRIAPNCQIRIAEDGEIQIKCRAVMKEYYKDPEKTKEAFTKDGYLKTGDIGYIDSDNYLFLNGRIKNLIILSNGENVSPEKLENFYSAESLVQESIVYGHEDVLCVEIFPNYKYAESVNISKENIKEALWEVVKKINKDLPSYEKVVKLTVRDKPFEKTASKKIIRSKFMEEIEEREKALEEKQKQAETTKIISLPVNDMQMKIYNIIKNCLGQKEFGIDSDLYEHGLDSFNCMLLTSRLSDEFNINIKLADIVHNSSVVKLEKFINDSLGNSVDLSVREVYPMATNQILLILAFKGTMCNISLLYKLDQEIELQKLKTSIEKLIDIHVELKSTIRRENNQFNIYRHDDYKVDIPIEKMTDAEWEEKKDHLIKPYHDDDRLYNIKIIETESDNYLLFDISHLMSDGFSFKVLMRDLDAIYSGKTVEPKDITFYEHLLIRKADVAKTYTKCREYFFSEVEDIIVQSTPFIRRDAYYPENNISDRFRGDFTKIDIKQLKDFCEKNGVTENTLFSMAANHAYTIYENTKHAFIDNINSGRLDEKWKRSIGCFARYYPLRYDSKDDETVLEALQESNKKIMRAIAEDHTVVIYNNFYFQYQNDIIDIDSIGGKPITYVPINIDSFYLQITVYIKNDRYIYNVAYWKNIYDEQQLLGFVKVLEDVVVSIISGKAKYIKDIKEHLSEENLITKRTVSVEKLHEKVGKKIISCEDEKNTYVNAYVLNDDLKRQVNCGWGHLYLEENEYVNMKEKIDNPFGEGKLGNTGFTAKFLPDGDIYVLENDCRFIMWDLKKNGNFQNINIIEKTLLEYEGVEKATTALKFVKDEFKIVSRISGEKKPDMEKLNEFLKSKIEEKLIPYEIEFEQL